MAAKKKATKKKSVRKKKSTKQQQRVDLLGRLSKQDRLEIESKSRWAKGDSTDDEFIRKIGPTNFDRRVKKLVGQPGAFTRKKKGEVQVSRGGKNIGRAASTNTDEKLRKIDRKKR